MAKNRGRKKNSGAESAAPVSFWASLTRSQISSALSTAVDFGLLFFLTEIVHVWYVASTACGAFAGALANFSINRHWSFEVSGQDWKPQAFRYAWVSFVSLLLNAGGVWAVTEGFHIPYGYSVIIVSLAVGFGFNYPLHRFYVFAREENPEPPAPVKLLLAAVIGGVCGTIGDFGHFACGIDSYSPQGAHLPWLGLPIWVPALFSGATLAIALFHLSVHWLLRERDRPRGKRRKRAQTRSRARIRTMSRRPTRWLAAGSALFLALYLLSAFIPPEAGWIKDVAIASGAILLWVALDCTALGATLAVLTAVGGTAGEAWLIAHGVFYYLPASVAFLGVPSWLPWLYATASIAIGGLLKVLKLTD